MPKEEQILQQGGYQAPAVHRAFQLLRAVAEAPHGLKLVELADQLGFSRSTTHGLVHALLREKALVQGEDAHQLFLGPTIADLAFADLNYTRLNRLAQPIINEVRNRFNLTVFVGVRIHKRIMIAATAEAKKSLKISAPLGTTIPIFTGAVGKVFLAQETPERIAQLAGERGLPRFTSKSICDMEAYLAELQQVRSQGYATDDEEYLSGMWAVAAALHNRRGLPIGIWVVGFASNMEPGKLEEIARIVIAAAKDLKSQLNEGAEAGLRSTVTKQNHNAQVRSEADEYPESTSNQ